MAVISRLARASFALALALSGCGAKHPALMPDAGVLEAGGTQEDGGEVSSRARIVGVKLAGKQEVLAPASPSPCAEPPACSGSDSINCYGGLASLADEHSTVIPPGTFPGHGNDYLFFVPTKTCLNGDRTATTGSTSGLVVLSGGSGPNADGRWTLDFAQDYGLYNETLGGKAVQGYGQLFLSPVDRTSCPALAAPNQDPTFDLNYANPSSVLVDPTTPGSLLMVYEGTNRCIGYDPAKGVQDNNFYSMLGVATSLDFGHTWPSYRTNEIPLPHQSQSDGPRTPLGAEGGDTCLGNNCSTVPAANFGRYAVLSAPVTAAELVATGQPLSSKSMGDSEPSGFIDDVSTSGDLYLYTVQNFGTGIYAYPGTQSGGVLGVARAKLGTQGLLKFTKWFGADVRYGGASAGGFAPASVTVTGANCGPGSAATTTCQISNNGLGSDGGGLESPIFPQSNANDSASAASCQSSNQKQLGGSISYVETTQEYLLLFICNSPMDPANPSASLPTGSTRGAAWFYATLDATKYDLSRQDQWGAPREIPESWAWLTSNANEAGCPSGGCSACVYDGWYPSLMSIGTTSGHLGASGYVFSMQGCQDVGAGSPRSYVSRAFNLEFGAGS